MTTSAESAAGTEITHRVSGLQFLRQHRHLTRWKGTELEVPALRDNISHLMQLASLQLRPRLQGSMQQAEARIDRHSPPQCDRQLCPKRQGPQRCRNQTLMWEALLDLQAHACGLDRLAPIKVWAVQCLLAASPTNWLQQEPVQALKCQVRFRGLHACLHWHRVLRWMGLR